MLDRLLDYARRENLVAEPGFTVKQVRWALDFAEDGRFIGVLPLGDASDKRNPGQEFPRRPDLSQPELTSGSEIRSHFLVETCQVVGPVSYTHLTLPTIYSV